MTKDGQRVFVSLTVSPIRVPSGEIVGASVIARDITERHRAADRAERLQDVTIKLAREIRPERTVEVLLDNALPAMGAVAGAVALLNRDGDALEIAGSAGYTSAGVERYSSMPLDANLPMTDVFRSGDPLWLSNSDELWARYPQLPGTRSEHTSLAIVPLAVGDTPFGAVSLSFDEAHVFGVDERAFMASVSAQAAHALERGRLFEAERRRLQQLAFIAEASELLVESLDIDPTLKRLAALAVPRIGDWCSIDLVTEDGGLRNVAVAHADPARVELAEELQARYPPDDNAPTGPSNVVHTGESELYAVIGDELIAEAAVDDEHRRLIRELGMVSAMIVPLTARDRTLGAMTLVSAESNQRYTDANLRLAEELARHAALAVDNAMLYRREYDAAVTLQRALLPQRIPAPKTAEVWGTCAPRFAPTSSTATSPPPRSRASTASWASSTSPRWPRSPTSRSTRPLAGSSTSARATRRLSSAILGARCTPSTRKDARPSASRSRPPSSRSRLSSRPGSVLLLYTDGLVERRGEGIATGLKRLRDAFAGAPEDAEGCAEALIATLDADELADDAALIALRFTEPR